MGAVEPCVLPSTLGHLQALYGGLDRSQVALSVVKPGRRGWTTRCFRPDDLDAAARWGTEAASAGCNVYTRTSTLRDVVTGSDRGTAEQTDAVLSLFGDIDFADPGHSPNPDGLPLPADVDAARQLLADVGAQPSMTVFTGGGLQPWWLLDEPWYLDTPDDLAAAKAFVRRWGEGLVEHGLRRGWHVDNVGDISRVGRLCGTTRYKPGVAPNMVTLDSCGTWPVDGLTLGGRWRPGPLYTLEQLEKRIVQAPDVVADGAHRDVGVHQQHGADRHHDRDRDDYGPAAAMSEACSWSDILQPLGWTHTGLSTIDGSPVELWRRPGGDVTSPYSLKCFTDGPAVAWSSNCGLPVGAGRTLNKWKVYVELYHHGDKTAAGRHVRAEAQAVKK